MKKLLRIQAFTIVELLVVIGIISVLAVALLISLNPAEAQRRARDAQRIKDANTLQAILESYINDGNAAPCSTLCQSTTVTGNTAAPCASGSHWLGAIDLCTYAKTIPVDPANGQTRTCYGWTTAQVSSTACTARYLLQTTGSNYEIGIIQESPTNARKVGLDGGLNGVADSARLWMQIYSGSPGIITFTNP